MIARCVNKNYDEEMASVLRFTNKWVSQQVQPEYAAAMAKHDAYHYTEDTTAKTVVVKGKHAYAVSLNDWSCDCSFALTMRLPCRHAIAWRLHKRLPGAAIPLHRIDPRYVIATSHDSYMAITGSDLGLSVTLVCLCVQLDERVGCRYHSEKADVQLFERPCPRR